MGDTIKLGSLDISAFKVGSADCKIYLGDVELYPQTPIIPKWVASYVGGTTSSAECSTSSITQNEITTTGLLTLEIGSCVTEIGDFSIYQASNLTSVTIADSVTTIGTNVFKGCSSLQAITIPDSVTSIGQNAFQSCTALTSINMPSGLTSISDYTFSGCTSLSSITIPNGVTSIGRTAFYRCSGLTSVTIPSGVTSIGQSAFYNCSGLTAITVLATVPPSISNTAFSNTNNCPIMVPASSLASYQSAWSSYSSRLQPIGGVYQWETFMQGDDPSLVTNDIDGIRLTNVNDVDEVMAFIYADGVISNDLAVYISDVNTYEVYVNGDMADEFIDDGSGVTIMFEDYFPNNKAMEIDSSVIEIPFDCELHIKQ